MDGAMLVTVIIGGGGCHLSVNVVRQPIGQWLSLQSKDVLLISLTDEGEGDTCFKMKIRHQLNYI